MAKVGTTKGLQKVAGFGVPLKAPDRRRFKNMKSDVRCVKCSRKHHRRHLRGHVACMVGADAVTTPARHVLKIPLGASPETFSLVLQFTAKCSVLGYFGPSGKAGPSIRTSSQPWLLRSNSGPHTPSETPKRWVGGDPTRPRGNIKRRPPPPVIQKPKRAFLY